MTTPKVATGTVSVKVHILEKEYQIQCPPDEKHQLIRAAVDVDTRMREAKSIGANISAEKAAVLSALNLANELQGTTDNSDMLDSVSDSIIDMKARIEKVLTSKPEISKPEDSETKAQAQLL